MQQPEDKDSIWKVKKHIFSKNEHFARLPTGFKGQFKASNNVLLVYNNQSRLVQHNIVDKNGKCYNIFNLDETFKYVHYSINKDLHKLLHEALMELQEKFPKMQGYVTIPEGFNGMFRAKDGTILKSGTRMFYSKEQEEQDVFHVIAGKRNLLMNFGKQGLYPQPKYADKLLQAGQELQDVMSSDKIQIISYGFNDHIVYIPVQFKNLFKNDYVEDAYEIKKDVDNASKKFKIYLRKKDFPFFHFKTSNLQRLKEQLKVLNDDLLSHYQIYTINVI